MRASSDVPDFPMGTIRESFGSFLFSDLGVKWETGKSGFPRKCSTSARRAGDLQRLTIRPTSQTRDAKKKAVENLKSSGNWFPIPEKPVSYVSIDYLCKLFIATSSGGWLWKKLQA